MASEASSLTEHDGTEKRAIWSEGRRQRTVRHLAAGFDESELEVKTE